MYYVVRLQMRFNRKLARCPRLIKLKSNRSGPKSINLMLTLFMEGSIDELFFILEGRKNRKPDDI